MARAERKGKVLIDWSQNAEHKTTVSVYSLRAKGERPFVSIPVSWSEVESALPEADAYSLTFSPDRAVERVRKLDDLFAPVLSMRQVISDDVLRELNVAASTAPPEPLTIRKPVANSYSLPRSSGQGGRKLFVIHRNDIGFELALEIKRSFPDSPRSAAAYGEGSDSGRDIFCNQGINVSGSGVSG
jgi:hypothetical protein